MDRNYTLPLAMAAAAHAVLLFGFSKPPRVASIPDAPLRPTEPFVQLIEVPPPDEIPSAAHAAHRAAKPPPPTPQPRSVEPLNIDPGTSPLIMPRPPAVKFDSSAVPTFEVNRGPLDGAGKAWSGNFLPIDLDDAPKTRLQVAPLFPFEAKKDGLRGEVLVEFLVDEQGRVVNPHVVHSSNRVFEEPTLRAVAKWLFEPGRRNGRVVRFRMSVPIVFNLSD